MTQQQTHVRGHDEAPVQYPPCHESLFDEKGPEFDTGVQLIAQRYDFAAPFLNTMEKCDLCGSAIPAAKISSTEEAFRLCPGCRRRLDALPEGKIKDCINRFIDGNVI